MHVFSTRVFFYDRNFDICNYSAFLYTNENSTLMPLPHIKTTTKQKQPYQIPPNLRKHLWCKENKYNTFIYIYLFCLSTHVLRKEIINFKLFKFWILFVEIWHILLNIQTGRIKNMRISFLLAITSVDVFFINSSLITYSLVKNTCDIYFIKPYGVITHI